MANDMDSDPLDKASPLMPEEWTVSTPKFDGQAEAVVGTLEILLRLLASHGSNLRSLDGVTLAPDCRAVAAKLQRWSDDKGPCYRSERGSVVEMARTVPVWRGAELRFHIVLQEAVGWMVLSEEKEDQVLALSCLAHEAAHVEHEGNLFRCCPHIFGGRLPCGERSSRRVLTAMDTWSEYAACRSSAFFRPAGAHEFDKLFEKAMQDAIDVANCTTEIAAAEKEQTDRGDRKEEMLGGLFVYAGYFFGHFDGLPLHREQKELTAMDRLEEWPEIHRVFLRVHEVLRQLWLTESKWKGLDVFFPLCDLLEELIGMTSTCWQPLRPFLVATSRNQSS